MKLVYMSEIIDGQRVRIASDEDFYTVRNPRPSVHGATVYDIEYANGSVSRKVWAGVNFMVEVAE